MAGTGAQNRYWGTPIGDSWNNLTDISAMNVSFFERKFKPGDSSLYHIRILLKNGGLKEPRWIES